MTSDNKNISASGVPDPLPGLSPRDEYNTALAARHAGEMISEVTAAMVAGLGLGRLAAVIHPYPTQAEAIRQTGDLYNRTRLTPGIKRLFTRFLSWRR